MFPDLTKHNRADVDLGNTKCFGYILLILAICVAFSNGNDVINAELRVGILVPDQPSFRVGSSPVPVALGDPIWINASPMGIPVRELGKEARVFSPMMGVSAQYSVRLGSCGMGVPAKEPAFFDPVGHIVLVGSEKEMVRPNATFVIAMVTNHQSAGDFSVMHHPGYPVRAEWLSGYMKRTVTALGPTCRPIPAPIGFRDLFPKQICVNFFNHSTSLPDVCA